MNFKFGDRSKRCLTGCHPEIRDICADAIAVTPIDFMVISGWRGQAEQTEYFETGKSKTPWPKSKHNNYILPMTPNSLAIDFVPYIAGSPVDWEDTHAFAIVAGVLMSCAIRRGSELRWGGDWDRDGSTRDQSFMDWGHVELAA